MIDNDFASLISLLREKGMNFRVEVSLKTNKKSFKRVASYKIEFQLKKEFNRVHPAKIKTENVMNMISKMN